MKRISIVIVLAAFAACAVAVAQQRKVIDEARFGKVEVKRTRSHVIKPARTLVVPWHINYQGYLTDDAGNPINDTLSMTFGIWDDPGVGSELWNENGNVVVEEGLFNVVLGSTTPIPSDVFGTGLSRWLELTVVAQTLSPRTEITSVGYAYRSVKADSADDAGMVDGFDASATPGAGDLFPLSAGDVQYVNEGQTDAITSDMILDGTIVRGDVEPAFKAPYADTADYALAANVLYVDSARVSENSWRLEDHSLADLDSIWVNEGQTDAVTSGMILDGTIARVDVEPAFKAPYSDTADYALAANVTYVDSARISEDSWKLENNTLTDLDSRWVNEGQADAVTSGMILDGEVGTLDLGDDAVNSAKILDGTIVRADVEAAFKAPYSDTADYALAANVTYVDSARISEDSWKLENNTLTDLDSRWVNEGQADAVTSGMILDGEVGTLDLGDDAVNSAKILDGTIVRADVEAAFKAPYSDTADYALAANVTYVDSARISEDSWKLENNTLTDLDSRWVNEGQADAVTSGMILDATVMRPDVADTFKAPYSDTADYALNAGNDSDWTITGNILHPSAEYGLAMNTSDVLHGDSTYTHVNLGIVCTTGTSGEDYKYCTVSGGWRNTASAWYSTVSGGVINRATGFRSSVGGGEGNAAGADYATVAGGNVNVAGGTYSTVAGGWSNTASGSRSSVGGGYGHTVNAPYATVAGGNLNVASGMYSTVAGGWSNMAGGSRSTVGGGYGDTANADYATVAGGVRNVAAAAAATVAGGSDNAASGVAATVGGGFENTASNLYAAVGGGWDNTANADYATVAGGVRNVAAAAAATVAGGSGNVAGGGAATVGGGYENTASNLYATVSGGWDNTADADYATVSGGRTNASSAVYGTVGGGYGNTVTGVRATISGGSENAAGGAYAAVGGGYADTAAGDYSFAAGDRVSIDSDADYTFGFGRNFSTSTPNAVIFHNSVNPIRVGIGITAPTHLLDVGTSGAYCDGGVWIDGSSREYKEEIVELTLEEAVEAVSRLTPVTYNYKSDADERCVGFIAEDVPDIVATKDRKGLAPMDIVAVLTRVVQHQQKEIELLRKEIEALKQ